MMMEPMGQCNQDCAVPEPEPWTLSHSLQWADFAFLCGRPFRSRALAHPRAHHGGRQIFLHHQEGYETRDTVELRRILYEKLTNFFFALVLVSIGEIFELREDLNSMKEEKKKEAVKKVIAAMTIGTKIVFMFLRFWPLLIDFAANYWLIRIPL